MSWTLRTCWNPRLERLRRYDDETYRQKARAHGAQWTPAALMSHVSKRSTAAQTMGCVSLSFRCWWETAPATLEKNCNKSASAMFVRLQVSEHELCLKCFVYQRGPQSSDMTCDIVRWGSHSHYIATFSVCRVKGAADVVFVRIIGSDGGLAVTEWILHSSALPSQDTVDPQIRGGCCRQFWSMLPLINTNSVIAEESRFRDSLYFFFARRWLQARPVCLEAWTLMDHVSLNQAPRSRRSKLSRLFPRSR